MEKLLKKILEVIYREQSWFTEVESITKYSDDSVHIVHLANYPSRKIEVDLPSIEAAVDYVNAF